MDSALTEISEFIQAIPPMDLLPSHTLEQVVKEISICYVRRGESLPPKGVIDENLYILRKGALSYVSADDELLGRYGEGEICTVFCFNNDDNIKVTTDEDTLLYSINYHNFHQLVGEFSDVMAFFQHTSEQRLNKKMLKNIMNKPIIKLTKTLLLSIFVN